MKKLTFSLLFILLVYQSVLWAGGAPLEIFCKDKKVASGFFLSPDLAVTTDSILLYNNIHFKTETKTLYNYRIEFIDRVTKLVFLRIKDARETPLDLPEDNILVETEPLYIHEKGKRVDVGFFTRKLNGYGAFISEDKSLYEGTPLYDIEDEFAGVLIGNLDQNLYLFLYADMLAFYRDHLNMIITQGRPVLNIVVTEMWEYSGIRVKESRNDLVEKGDIIVGLANFQINNVLDFNRALYLVDPASPLTLKVIRNGKLKRVTLNGGK